jgi:hypothetical protein
MWWKLRYGAQRSKELDDGCGNIVCVVYFFDLFWSATRSYFFENKNNIFDFLLKNFLQFREQMWVTNQHLFLVFLVANRRYGRRTSYEWVACHSIASEILWMAALDSFSYCTVS